jgi:hypothetical protein
LGWSGDSSGTGSPGPLSWWTWSCSGHRHRVQQLRTPENYLRTGTALRMAFEIPCLLTINAYHGSFDFPKHRHQFTLPSSASPTFSGISHSRFFHFSHVAVPAQDISAFLAHALCLLTKLHLTATCASATVAVIFAITYRCEPERVEVVRPFMSNRKGFSSSQC